MKRIATIILAIACVGLFIFGVCIFVSNLSIEIDTDNAVTTSEVSSPVTTSADFTYATENTGDKTKICDNFYWAVVDETANRTTYGLYYLNDGYFQLVIESSDCKFYEVGDKICYYDNYYTISSVDKNDFDNVITYGVYIYEFITADDEKLYCSVGSSIYIAIDAIDNTYVEIDYVDIPKTYLQDGALYDLFSAHFGNYQYVITDTQVYFTFAENGDYIFGEFPAWVSYNFTSSASWHFGIIESAIEEESYFTDTTLEYLKSLNYDYYNTYLTDFSSLTTEELDAIANDEDSITAEKIFEMVEQLQNSDIFIEYFIDSPDGFCAGYNIQAAQEYILQDDSKVTYLYFTDDGYVEVEKPEEFTQGNTELENGYYLVFAPYYFDDDVEVEVEIVDYLCRNIVVGIFD